MTNNSENSDSKNSDDVTSPQHEKISMVGQYLKDLSFENPNAPKSLNKPGENPNIQIEIGVNATKVKEDVFEVVLEFTADAKSEENFIYKIELAYAGLFKVENFPEDVIQQVLLIACPAYLFPFVRSLVLQLTHEGGFPTLQLDPIDFAGLYKENLTSEAAEKRIIN